MTTKYPNQIDTNTEIPLSTDNITEIKAEVTNTLRGAILAIESELGTNPSTTFSTVRARLDTIETLLKLLNGDSINILQPLDVILSEGNTTEGTNIILNANSDLVLFSGSSIRGTSGTVNIDDGLNVVGPINVNSNLISGVLTPVSGTDAANKDYVDSSLFSSVAGGDLTGIYPDPQIAVGVVYNDNINTGAEIDVSKLDGGVTAKKILVANTSVIPEWGALDFSAANINTTGVTSARLLGRSTSGTGEVEQISLNSTLEFTVPNTIRRAALTGDVNAVAGSNSTTVTDLTITGETQGSVLYFNGTNWVRLTPSTDGYVLTTHSTGQNPTWSNISGGSGLPSGPASGDLSGSFPNPTVTDLTITGETQGSVLYFNGSNWAQLSAGPDGYALVAHGASANPTWSNVSSGTVQLVTKTDAVLQQRAQLQINGALVSDDSTNSRSVLDLARVDIREFGAKASTQNTTATVSASSTSATLAAAIDFENGNGIALMAAGSVANVAAPPAPTCSVRGTPGSTTRTYYVAVVTANYGCSAGSAATAVTNTAATLNDTDYVRVFASAVASVHAYVETNVANLAAFTVALPQRTLQPNDRVLLTAQTTPTQNGIYVVGTVASGTAPLTRAADFAAAATIPTGTLICVRGTYANRVWQLTAGNIVATDALTFVKGEAYHAYVYVDDSRTGGIKRYLGAISLETDWDSSTASPLFYFDDRGATYKGLETWGPSNMPTAAVRNALFTRIVSGGGTVNLVLAAAPSASASVYVRHDNSYAFTQAIQSFSASGSSLGGEIIIPPASTYYPVYGSDIVIDKCIKLIGANRTSSKIGLGPGRGIRILSNGVSPTGSSADDSVLENFTITATNAWVPAGNFRAQDYTSVAADNEKYSELQGAVILVKAQITCDDVRIDGFQRSNGLVVSGRDDDLTNVNLSRFRRVKVAQLAGGAAIMTAGSDSNACEFSNCSATGCLVGLAEMSFLGNHYEMHHTESNSLCAFVYSAASFSTFVNFYSEGGQGAGRGNAQSVCVGGDHGAGWSGGLFLGGISNITGGWIFSTGTTAGQVSETHVGGSGNSTDFLRFKNELDVGQGQGVFTTYRTSDKRFSQYVSSATDLLWQIDTLHKYMRRALIFPRGFVFGDSTHERRWASFAGLPTAFRGQKGDLVLDTGTGAQRTPAAVSGVTTTTWATGTAYTAGDLVKPTTPNGYVYVARDPGTSHASTEPTWPTIIGNTVVDNTGSNSITWECAGVDGIDWIQTSAHAYGATLSLSTSAAATAGITITLRDNCCSIVTMQWTGKDASNNKYYREQVSRFRKSSGTTTEFSSPPAAVEDNPGSAFTAAASYAIASNNVEVRAAGDASEACTWRLRAFVQELDDAP